ncbi:hypothetical protein PPYR_00203 [Photinus pyralis]|uniref:Integrase catalytic domain-containing protein n=1 Tax=Photinus pyralis TaxID=7054 RepID=A0A5N4AY99_PHOPY|nr:hypothetical protein PPYR_04495 [Photinus pyralis]KAB0803233.1 hypothetical protein PPYR_00203 [Photinus pyralis]
MRRRIHQVIRGCDVCQKCKFPTRGLMGAPHSVSVTFPGELVTIDYYGRLPEGRSRVSYILVVIDSFSKHVKLYPLRQAQANISAMKVISDFAQRIPIRTILSDHGTQFSSKVWQDTMEEAWNNTNLLIYSTLQEPH